MRLFSKHLELLGIEHQMKDIPSLTFDSIEDETPLHRMQRASMGYDNGLLTLNQAMDIVVLPTIGRKGDERKEGSSGSTGELPREHSQPGVTDEQ